MASDPNATNRGWDFYLDSACSTHVTSRRDVFVEYTEIPEGKRPVKGSEGSVLFARGPGNIKLRMRLPNNTSQDVTIRNVLYVPGSANLISQGMLMELGLRIVPVNGYGVKIYNRNNTRLLACAPQVAWMYPFDLVWTGRDVARSGSSTLSALKTTAQTNGGVAQLRLGPHSIAHLGSSLAT
ncbi:hypothetical protein BZA05DRAFT_217646 [Tricharina praecox]|uniref:uncharacterized protein n=1 Tax=Tricharina praecox TaxID=43433 RepID=UPI00221EDF92|nr:uncharacterized protein BZA05DRAFT_217646 [Tricharina praecox]KAI5855780.1 hypothetical protein BZA05DRAFT_217646 [Tricharina praecox]